MGVKDIKGEVGKLDYLKEQFGLTSETIIQAAEKAVKEKILSRVLLLNSDRDIISV